MDINRENNGDLMAVIHINLEEADYSPSVDKQLNEYRRKAKMPGFRPGKVPMGMIRKMYGKSVLVEEVNKAVSEALNNYILENNINVLGYPLPNKEKTTQLDLEGNDHLDFYFDIGIAPDFNVELSDEISVPYYDINVKKGDIDKAIEDIKVRFGTEENPETAEKQDALQGNFIKLTPEGEDEAENKGHHAYFRIEDITKEEVHKKLIGAKVDDEVIINPVEAFGDESKARSILHIHDGDDGDLNADYKFKVEKVVRTKDAEVNEELFKKVYPSSDITTEKDFRERIEGELKQHFSRDSDRQFLADSINKLLEITPIELPDEFMKRWLVESNEGKVTEDDVEKEYDAYARTMRWQLIDAKLQEKHGDALKVEPNEVRAKVRAYFQGPGQAGEEPNPQIEAIIDQVLQNREEGERIYRGILDEKYTSLFKEQLKMDNKSVDSEKFTEIASATK